jgi:hypothetical protein
MPEGVTYPMSYRSKLLYLQRINKGKSNQTSTVADPNPNNTKQPPKK